MPGESHGESNLLMKLFLKDVQQEVIETRCLSRYNIEVLPINITSYEYERADWLQ